MRVHHFFLSLTEAESPTQVMVRGRPGLGPTSFQSQFSVLLPPHVASRGNFVSLHDETLAAMPFHSEAS